MHRLLLLHLFFPSPSSPHLLNDDLLDDILSHLPALSFSSAACVSKSWNQIYSQILVCPKLSPLPSLSTPRLRLR